MDNVFDPLKFYDDLKAADVPEKQARAQAEAMRNAFAAYDASRMRELATKGDLQLEIEKVRTEIKAAKIRLLKWQIGGGVALAAISWPKALAGWDFNGYYRCFPVEGPSLQIARLLKTNMGVKLRQQSNSGNSNSCVCLGNVSAGD